MGTWDLVVGRCRAPDGWPLTSVPKLSSVQDRVFAGLLGDLAARTHRDADVGLLERRVVDGAAGHRDDLAASCMIRASRSLSWVTRPKTRRLKRLADLLVGHRSTSAPLIAPAPSPSSAPNGARGDGVVAGDDRTSMLAVRDLTALSDEGAAGR